MDGGRRTDEHGLVRLAEQALPDGLTHGPTRRFLAEQGLPAAGADLVFNGLGAERLQQLGPGEAADDGRWLVLGETDYCGTAVVLDGATGEVHLADRAGGELLRDLIASDLPALAGLIREVESVEPAARQTDSHGGRRGPAVVGEVIAAAEQRFRAIDPRLFEADTPPAHWPTALLVRALHWGARPGEPGTLAYEFEPELVAELAAVDGSGEVRRYQPQELPAGLTHEPTRRLLTEVGLPLDGELFGVGAKPLRTMAEAHPGAATQRAHQRDYIAIGWWPHDLVVALDGATGRLELPDWYDDGGPAAYLHRDLSALLYACWTYGRLRDEWARWDRGAGDWELFDPRALLGSHVDAMVEAVDPQAFETSGHSWRMLAEDPYTGGLLA
ncbi:SUKH-4 family immunity protein [Kitasatospora sp. NPDC001175]|uniref:SUKH-4 family immunity protein n=1 Tax=Kitasatospora sp. NPDC001175 TaxID=3157103 RepID=UPI003D0258FC